MEKITTLAQLEKIIGTTMMKAITDQAAGGDPDWLTDMIGELDYNGFPVDGFHDVIIAAGYKTADFDEDALSKELIEKYPFSQDKYNELISKA